MDDYEIFRRAAKKEFSVELLAQLLNVEGRIVDADMDPSRGVVIFTVVHPDYQIVPEAGIPPVDTDNEFRGFNV